MPASIVPQTFNFEDGDGSIARINNGNGLPGGWEITSAENGLAPYAGARIGSKYLRAFNVSAQLVNTPPSLDSASAPFSMVHNRLGFWFRAAAFPVGGSATICTVEMTGPDVVGVNRMQLRTDGRLSILAGSIGTPGCTDRDEVRTLNPLIIGQWYYLVFDVQATNGKTFPSDSGLADGYGVTLFIDGGRPALDPNFGSAFGWGVYAGRRAISNFTWNNWRLGWNEAVTNVEMHFDNIRLGAKTGGSTIVLPIGKNFTFDGSNCILAGTSAIFAHAPDCVGGSVACGCVLANDCNTIFPIFGFASNTGLPAGPDLESDVPLYPFFIQTQPSAPAAENVSAGAGPGAPGGEGVDTPPVPPCNNAGCLAELATVAGSSGAGCLQDVPTAAGGCPT